MRAVFLDRDGVINRAPIRNGKPCSPRDVTELEMLPDVATALRDLKSAGFCLLVVTNQPEVARGPTSQQAVEAIHSALRSQLPLDDIFVCFHDDMDACDCRKPKPGLLFAARDTYGIDLAQSFMVGDRWRDVEAGFHAGCRTILIDHGYSERFPNHPPDHVCRSLTEAVSWILQPGSAETRVMSIDSLKVKIFADGADRDSMMEMHARPEIKGFTTNPTLMRKAGISDYEGFARDILRVIRDKPVSLEIFADDFVEMERQATTVSSWASNVYVKIPVADTSGKPTYPLVRRLAAKGIKLNVTAIMTLQQVRDVVGSLSPEVPSYISVFAGRIADTGVDPVTIVAGSVAAAAINPRAEVIWASTREILNIIQADQVGCQIITVTRDLLKKFNLIGYDLEKYSVDTIKLFHDDAIRAGYAI